MTTLTATPLTTVLPLGFMGFMLLRRYRRFTGPQLLDTRGRRRLLVRPVILGVLALLVLALPHPLVGYLAALAGAVLGTGLAFWSVRHTRFEAGPDGQLTQYIPNFWIGAGVFGLFVLRLVWRLWPLLGGTGWAAGATPAAGGLTGASPLTLGLFLLFAAYQVAYALLLLRAARQG